MSSAPLPPGLAEVAEALSACGWVRRVVALGETTSTNDVARALAADGAPDGTIVIADVQSAGRGRLGRAWHSPPGVGLYLSALLRPGGPLDSVGRYGLVAAVAACEACREVAGSEVTLKWPNDVVAAGRKLAGILSEARSDGSAIDLVVGIGVNVNHAAHDFTDELRDQAVSLRQLRRGERVDRAALAARVVEIWGDLLDGLRRGSWPEAAERFLRYAPHARGARVRLASGARGVTDGLDHAGALRVSTDSGVVAVHAGESVAVVEG